MDTDGTTGEAGRWLSYAELAAVRGITRKAAARLTLRHQWRRQPGNDGAVRVWVPEAEIPHRQDPRQTPRHEPTVTDGGPDSDAAVAAANARADAAIALADRLLTQLTEVQTAASSERQRAELATTELRTKIEQLQAELTAAEAGRGQVETDARELRAHEAALQLQLAQTTAAFQDAASSNARAEQAEAAIAAERARADDLQAGQELMMDMHARAQAALQGDLDMARAQATTAHDALRAVRQAEQDRQARGLLARLRAAVRGR